VRLTSKGERGIWRWERWLVAAHRWCGVSSVGKQTLALSHVVGTRFRANEVAFLLRLLNADTRFQLHCEAIADDEGRNVRRLGLEWRQFRFFNSPGRLLRTARGYILRVPANQLLADVWAFYAPDLTASQAEEVRAA